MRIRNHSIIAGLTCPGVFRPIQIRDNAPSTKVHCVKKSRYNDEQIVRILHETDQDTVANIAKRHGVPRYLHSDNGSEFAYHKKISNELNTEFYFAYSYSSWELGLNENTNGLVRQYLKKGSSFTEITDADLENIMDALNNRPRKSLEYFTPNEIFNSC